MEFCGPRPFFVQDAKLALRGCAITFLKFVLKSGKSQFNGNTGQWFSMLIYHKLPWGFKDNDGCPAVC